MKVLIIGVNSFTGQSLAEYLLQRNIIVYGTCNKKTDIIAEGMYSCDITKKHEIEQILHQTEPDCIINLAGISFVAHDDPFEFYKVNAFAVESILQSCLTLYKKPQKIILPSSSIVYGNQTVTELTENLIPKPQNHYGLSKFCMETIASWYIDKLNIIITRPFNYTGPKQDLNFLIPKIVDHFHRKAETIELGNINVYREFNDIEFVCDVYYQLLINDIQSGTYNICSGKGYCINDVLKIMYEITGHQIEIKTNPEFVRTNEISYLVGSTKKLKSDLALLKFINLEHTLSKMLELKKI